MSYSPVSDLAEGRGAFLEVQVVRGEDVLQGKNGQ